MNLRKLHLLLGAASIAGMLGCGGAARADFNPFGSYWDNIARAAANNDAYAVQQKIAADGNPNEVDDNGRSALQIAAINGNLQIAAIVIKAGAKLDYKDPLGDTALFYAADRNQLEMAKLLIDLGARVDVENKRGMTPLMAAASRGNLDLVKTLLDKGADPRRTDFTGRDAANWALEGHRPAVAQALKRATANAR